MPHRKKKKSGAAKGKRRIGKMSMAKSITANPIHLLAGAIVGSVVASYANVKMFTGVSNTVLGGGEVVAGGAALLMVKNPFVKGMGLGVAATGGAALVSGMGLLSGIGCTPGMTIWNAEGKRVAGVGGFRDVPQIGGRAPAASFPNPAGIGSARTRSIAMAAGSGAY